MEHLIQHFRKDEQPFIEKVIGWQREVEDRFAPKLTDFLDPRERFIVSSIIGQNDDLSVKTYGGFQDAERQRVFICPSYFEPTFEDFQVSFFTINYPSKFLQLKHPDVLGALLSLGFGRGKFGDIRIEEDNIQIAVVEEVQDYIYANLTSIGKAKIKLEHLDDKDRLITLTEEWFEKSYTVSSMRLDVIIATVVNISRQKSQSLIKAGKVKVNWTVREDTSFEVQEGDILSIRGFGRIKVIVTEGRTKKDKIRLQVGRLEQK
ncbi:MAG TPA: RNA-binding protein [Ureibacillus sp.]|nr:RNA-binding protein [Ureibacillus sp.]